MTPLPERPLLTVMRHELTALRDRWFWFVLLGIALIVPGGIAVVSPWVASLATALVIGFLLIGGGILESVGAVWCRHWSGFFLFLLSGIMSIVVGVLFVRAPVGALIVVTMLLAVLLMVGGLFKIVAGLIYRVTGWGWELLSGVIDLVLGVMIWQDLPESAIWVVGLFVGINLIFRGVHWIGIGMAVRSLPKLPADEVHRAGAL